MKTSLKIGGVVAGYFVAFVIASVVVATRIAATNGPDAQASSGMYAFGDAALFTAVFGVLSLAPTGAALFLLRPYRQFWTALSTIAVLIASTGVAAAVLFLLGRHAVNSTLTTAAGVSALRILIAPLLALTSLVCTLFSPHRSARLAFIAATLMEIATSACGAIAWFIPMLLHRP